MPDETPATPHPPGPTDADCRSLFESLPDAALILDRDTGRVVAANRAACAMYGFGPDEFVGRVPFDVSGEAECVPSYIRAAAAGGRHHAEVAARRKDGATIRVLVAAAAVDLAGRPAVVSVHRDVTEVEKTEGQRRHAAKMEAIGQLAGGVAHDFNNLLTVIQGYAEILATDLRPDDPAAEPLTEIAAAARRAADLTHQLLAFSRQQVLRPRPVCLRGLIANLMKMLTRLVGEHVRVTTVADPDLAPVFADPGQLEQVLVNLAVNARDAMPGGGTLTVECRNLAEPSGPCRFVRLLVSDTGAGMSDDVKARIFEPFYTTKGPGKGTGLGLATVFGIVQQSAGRIAVDSRVGVGTTFRIDLPVAVPDALATRPPMSGTVRAASLTRGTETILLVEDEDAVRILALHALQAQGYAVLDAENGEQAMRVMQAFGVPIRLLLTDVVMPKVGGRELADRLRAAQPGMRVLYTSGYPADEVVRHRIETDGVHFLQKPFTMPELTGRVREVLDGRPGVCPS